MEVNYYKKDKAFYIFYYLKDLWREQEGEPSQQDYILLIKIILSANIV